jgi:hypothetical protein
LAVRQRGVAERGPGTSGSVAAGLGEQDERVASGAAERGGESAVERELVARVGERSQVGEAVADLLLRPVAAAADDVRGQALLLERLLEQPQRRRGAHEHDDVPRTAAGADLLAQPVRDQAGLGPAPGLLGERAEPDLARVLVPALRVGDEQLDRRRARGRVRVEEAQLAVVGRRGRGVARAPRHERLERVAEHRRERGVQDVEQLRRRAEVRPQPAHPRGVELRPPLAEDLHVGVPEPVDRLELVADREEVVAFERLQQVQLEAVGVLELVDHQQREALAPAAALGLVGEQVAHAELEVLEVDRRPLRLAVGVLGGEAREQRVDQDHRGPRVVVRAPGPVGLPGGPVGLARLRRERLRARAELRRVELARRRHTRGREHALARRERAAALGDAEAVARPLQLGRRDRPRRRERARGRRRALIRDRQPQRGSARAQRVVRGQHEVPQARPVRGRQIDRGPAEGRDPGLQRALVRGGGDPPRGGLLEHREARIQPGGQRPRPQHARAEAVDRPDPRGVDGAGVLVLAEVGQPLASALAQLAGGLLREREREDRADRHLVEQHGLDESLDHHGGLARAGVGGEQRGARPVLDRGALLGGEAGRAHVSSSRAASPARQIPG